MGHFLNGFLRGEFLVDVFVGGSHLWVFVFVFCQVQVQTKPSTDEEAFYSSVRSANPHLKSYFAQLLSVNFLSIFGTCYIITFCSKHVDISFCILSPCFLSDKQNIFMNFNQKKKT